jgi:hypothetical protein
MTALYTACTTRLQQLRADLVTGRSQLQHLQETLLRIEGAVQVLEECLAEAAQEGAGATHGLEPVVQAMVIPEGA